MQKTSLDTWKAYFRWQLIHKFASKLSKEYVDEDSNYIALINGMSKQEPKWQRAINLLNHSLGEALGKLYVKQYFPIKTKAKAQELIDNTIIAYRQSITGLDWMSKSTKQQAQKKLDTMIQKIGYPDKWRDYSALVIKKDDLVGNIMRANNFEYQRNIDKLGKPLDRGEWLMTPQTINANYDPLLNDITFPAAFLQSPIFDAKADDAVNYGAIGSVIGHELAHAFDDEGSQYDEIGNLRDWWTKEDHQKFTAKTKQLIAQYGAYVPLEGYKLNGKLTLGENIADNSGLNIAYKAYQLSLKGNIAPIINNTTGDQRFYLSWGQMWRAKIQDAMIIRIIKSDPHSTFEFRVNGTLGNQPAFYDAFNIKAGDQMYLPPENRVIIW